MAHFFRPTGVPPAGYDVDGKQAVDSVWRMQISRGSSKKIALYGGDRFWIKSNNPTVVSQIPGDGIQLPTANGVKLVTLYGASFGTAMITAGPDSSPWLTLQVQVVASDGKLPETAFDINTGISIVAALPEDLFSTFIIKFAEGAMKSVQKSQLKAFSSNLIAHPIQFQIGFRRGEAKGLFDGIKDFFKSIPELASLAISLAPRAAAISLVVANPSIAIPYVTKWLLDPKTQQYPLMIGNALTQIANEFILNPPNFSLLAADAGFALGDAIGTELSSDILIKSPDEVGEIIGYIEGRIVSEIVIAIAIELVTEGVGYTARAGMKIGKASPAAQKLAAYFMRRPGYSRIMKILADLMADESAALGSARALSATIDAEIEAAFGEGAILQRGSAGSFPVLNELPQLSSEARLAASRLLGQKLDSRLIDGWNACSNSQALKEITEVERLLKTGNAMDRESAYRLSESTYNNWRDRFWRKVRTDSSLRSIFTDAGAIFEGKSGAPFYRIGPDRSKNLTVTLDHFIERRVDNPARAVDGLNVRPVIGFENSVTLESIRRDNFLKGWANGL